MRKVLCICAVLALSSVQARSEEGVHGFLEGRSAVTNNPIEGGELHFSIRGPLDPEEQYESLDRWGWFAWGLVNRDFALGYVGPTYRATDWLTAGVGLGMQTGTHNPLLGSFAFLHQERWYALGVYEYVEGSSWWQVTGNYELSERWGVGLHGEDGLGWGPRAQYCLGPKSIPVTLWVAAPVDGDGVALVLGSRISF